MTVLMRPPMPALRDGVAIGVDHIELASCRGSACCISIGKLVPDLVRTVRGCSAGTSPPSRRVEHVELLEKLKNWWQAMKLAVLDQVGASGSARGPNRRCETVTEPAFFES